MLSHLYIDNLVMVDQLDLPLRPGMTVITGETGAGKSIMLDAIGLALGDRASAALVGPARAFAEVCLTFDLSCESSGSKWLARRDLKTEGNECLLRRTINQDGRSRAWINGRPATLADLRALGELLLDLYSQHEHQSLLKKNTQRRLLDDFGGLSPLAGEVRELFRKWQALSSQRAEMQAASEAGSAEIQLLEYQLQELASLAPEPEEYASLLTEQKQLANSAEARRICGSLAEGLSGEERPVLGFIAKAKQALGSLEDERLQAVLDLLCGAEIQLGEAARDLGRLGDTLTTDPERAAEVDERLTAFFELARKHKTRPENLPELMTEISGRLQLAGGQSESLQRIQQQEQQLAKDWQNAATRLHKGRVKAAGRLAEAVSAQLRLLAIQGRFEVRTKPLGQPAAEGLDSVEFHIATHEGAEPAPLASIASGGELSRISLAIQVLASRSSEVPTLIFDEVDVGIGGAVAEITGSLLRELAGHTQIITVTHLGQVACQGHNHLAVHKLVEPKGVRTRVSVLDENLRIEEIARMLGGVEVTTRTLDHAREMYQAAQGQDF